MSVVISHQFLTDLGWVEVDVQADPKCLIMEKLKRTLLTKGGHQQKTAIHKKQMPYLWLSLLSCQQYHLCASMSACFLLW